MNVLIVGIAMFAIGSVAYAMGGWVGVLALIAGFTLLWWASPPGKEAK